MTAHDFDTFAELESFVGSLQDSQRDHEGRRQDLLYRGQADSKWNLETTLERVGYPHDDLIRYYYHATAIKGQVEAFSGHRWDDVPYDEYAKLLKDYAAVHYGAPPLIEYLIYLRHHGYPSPLLDWTRSLYIAAFFALRKSTSERVAVFALQHRGTHGTKCQHAPENGSPEIVLIDETKRTHPRHYLQQGNYTLCARLGYLGWMFASYQSIFSDEAREQNYIWKLTFPRSERRKMAYRFSSSNINAFSLMQSEEGLLEHLAATSLYLEEA